MNGKQGLGDAIPIKGFFQRKKPENPFGAKGLCAQARNLRAIKMKGKQWLGDKI
jgi:hypothetical protein